MNQSQSFRLRTAMLVAVASLLVISVLTNIYQSKVLAHTSANSRLLGEFQQLNELTKSIKRSANNYQSNAARDYESYFRDIAVFLSDLKASINQFDTLLLSTSNRAQNELHDLVPPLFSTMLGAQTNRATIALTTKTVDQSWQIFMTEFEQSLGEKADEPRIEWGARYIIENSEELEHNLHFLMAEYESFLDQQVRGAITIFHASLVITLSLGLAVLIWFYLWVARPIGSITKACLRVANGDFGYTLPVTGKDELSQLSQAFNSVSSRSEMVLNLLAQLQQARSADEANTIICRASGRYVPIAWSAILKTDQTGTAMTIESTVPPNTRTQLRHYLISTHSSFGRNCSNAMISKQSFIESGLINAAVGENSDSFLRELVRFTQINSVLCVPLYNHQGWEGMLIFGTKSGDYTLQHAELLSRLAPMIASHLQRIV